MGSKNIPKLVSKGQDNIIEDSSDNTLTAYVN